MLENGFAIKEGQSDLKPYVYAAARAIEKEVSAPLLAKIADLELEAERWCFLSLNLETTFDKNNKTYSVFYNNRDQL